ncbi:MAG: archaetidylserine decarboxylase [Gammaproteobacteria bacterium]|nr:archaetidylserine decarboxylase [Gammaproteobacteria bacterium]
MHKLFIYIQRIVPHHALSRLIGFLADSRLPWFKNLCIDTFINVFHVDMQDSARKKSSDFANFNDFFTRELSAGARTINGNITCPADGTVSAVGKIEHNQIFQAKELTYSLEKLLASDNVTGFIDGSFITIYLAPNNYHRVHFPTDASLQSSRYVPGKLFSVNQVTTNKVHDLFADNERLICDTTTNEGSVSIIMIGAMIVAGIKTTWRASAYPAAKFHSETFDIPRQYQKGDELGQFHLGSTVILLFQQHVSWRVQAGDSVCFGDSLA